MKTFKRFLLMIFCGVLFSGALIGFSGCNQENGGSSNNLEQVQTVKSQLTLAEYSVTLYEGETYTLLPKKTDCNGKELSTAKITYSSDREYVANCSNCIVTAVSAGQTYIHLTDGDCSVALFVTVKKVTNADKVFIRFTEEQLYAGVSVQGHVYTFINDKPVEITNVEWSTESEELEVSKTGFVTPKECVQSAVIKAKCTVDGVDYLLEKELSVVEPLYYILDKPRILLATGKTYSGENNEAYTTATLVVNEHNLRTGVVRQMEGAELDIDADEDLPYFVTKKENGTITFVAKNIASNSSAIIQIPSNNRRLKVDIDVAYAMASIKDMDKLSLASYSSPTDLDLSYILVNDIDYDGNIIYPIALWRENANRTVSEQWRYLLDYSNGKYQYIERSLVGSTKQGLTDAEWLIFCNGKGINPSNKSFTGVFDGNGYAIKNAKLMFAPFVTSPTTGVYSGAGTSVFGYVVNGTLRNIEFDISLQTVSDIEALFGNDLSKTVSNGAILDFDWAVSKNKYVHFSSTILYRTQSASVYNVYVHLNLPSEMSTNRYSAGILGWANDTTAYNNIVFLENNTGSLLYYGIQAEGSFKIFENNLAIGVNTIGVGFSEQFCGTFGNWWTNETDFSKLALLSTGGAATNVMSFADTLSSFDVTIWNLQGLSLNVVPSLLDGCSVRS